MTDAVPEGHSVEEKSGWEEKRITVRMQSHCFVLYDYGKKGKEISSHIFCQLCLLPLLRKNPQGRNIQWDVYPQQRLSQQNGGETGREGMELLVSREGSKNAAVSDEPLLRRDAPRIQRAKMEGTKVPKSTVPKFRNGGVQFANLANSENSVVKRVSELY